MYKLILFGALALGLVSCQTRKEDEPPKLFGIVTFYNVTSNSFSVGWPKAADNETGTSLIKYKMVYGTAAFGDAGQAEASGQIALDWSANTLDAQLNNLKPATPYYVAVLAKDTQDHITFLTGMQATLCAGKMIFLASVPNGNFGGKVGADSICERAKPTEVTGPVKALLSQGSARAACYLSGNDNCSIVGEQGRTDWPLTPNTVYCSNHYLQLLATTDAAGFLKGLPARSVATSATLAYTGLNAAYGSSANNCGGWTSAGAAVVGGDAAGSSSDNSFYSGQVSSCDKPGVIYCVEM